MNNGQRLPDEQEPTEEQESAALDSSQQGDRDTLRLSPRSLPQDPGHTVPARPAPEERTAPVRPTPSRAMPQDPERTAPMRPASGQRRQPPQQPAPTQRRPQPRDPGRTVHSRPSPGRAPDTEPRRPVPQRTGYVPPPQRPVAKSRPTRQPAPPPKTRRRPARRRDWRGGLIRGSFISALGLVILIFAGIALATVGYVYIAQQLPPAQELWGRQIQWVSSRIYDRDGALLWELVDPHGGRRTRVTLDRVSPFLIDATIATEDERFREHRGFSPYAIARAFYQNFRAKEIVSGFSTITQQVARNLLLSAEERHQETFSRKFKEVVLAVEIERRYKKDQILEIYLNENNYGNLAYGIEAAAQTYFGKSAQDLNLAEAALLAGLPQSPAIHDPFVNPDGALARQADVLRLMVEATRDGHLSPGISQEQADAASAEMAGRIETLTPPRSDIPAPHFVQYVRQQLEAKFGPDLLYRGVGLHVYTTLDLDLQRVAEREVREGVAGLAERNVSNGALVAIDPRSGEIKAMVGSVDFNDTNIDGQVNVALRCRQPGSSIKPLTFLAAFEQGWTPSTLIWDVRTEYPNPPNPPYVPRNYDDAYHGNTLLRAALANSYNVPAVKALDFVGVQGLLDMADRLGVVSLSAPEKNCPEYPYDEPPFYGLALTLGSGEAKLLEMTGAFAVFANGGVRIPPTAVQYIESANGDLIADYRERPGGRVLAAQHAYLITHILSDYKARCPAFGCPNTLQLDGRAAAAKTGTTTDYRDAWAIGYTPELVTGVWVGNSDNTPMTNVPGSRGAGPIWKSFMTQALRDAPPSLFERPPGIIEQEICVDSGTSPSEYCPNRRMEVFSQGQPPLDARNDLWQAVFIDALSGLRANEYCMGNAIEKVFFVVPPEAHEWAIAHGYEQPPEEFCSAESRPQVSITAPLQDESVPQGRVPVYGQVQLPNFKHYDVLYGVGTNPQAMGWVSGPHLAQVSAGGLLTEWDTSNLSPGPYTLRVVAYTHDDVSVQAQVIVNVAAFSQATVIPEPTSAPPPTNTPPPTALPTETPLPTDIPTETPLPTDIPTETPLPTDIPAETPLPEASPTPEPAP